VKLCSDIIHLELHHCQSFLSDGAKPHFSQKFKSLYDCNITATGDGVTGAAMLHDYTYLTPKLQMKKLLPKDQGEIYFLMLDACS